LDPPLGDGVAEGDTTASGLVFVAEADCVRVAVPLRATVEVSDFVLSD
jgi:hypothetical protein